jgi:hypothetical protein
MGAVSLVGLALVVTACGGPTPGSPTPASSATGLATSGAPASSPSPTGSPDPSPIPSSDVAVDLTLADHLPASVDGVALEPDPATSAQVAADPGLSEAASALLVSLAATGSETADDLAIVSVVRLRPGVFGDAFFRSWRDSYDGAACEAAGGVSGHAETEIGGRATYIGTCAGGAHTYHVRLEGEDDVVVSVTAVGDRRLGEQVIAGLTE